MNGSMTATRGQPGMISLILGSPDFGSHGNKAETLARTGSAGNEATAAFSIFF
ncbi:MAG: hypothetical protein WC508_01705 [Patescibacteria group bacterium]